MIATLLIATTLTTLWYGLPLLVAVSLVYSATRHEDMKPILMHALRFAVGVIAFMLVIMVVLMYASSRT